MIAIYADTNNLKLQGLPTGIESVDVCFDGVRVWSIDVRAEKDSVSSAWPLSVKPYLIGATRISIVDSLTLAKLAENEVVFTAANQRVSVVDSEGIPLSVNKWGRLGHSLEAIGGEIEQVILNRSVEIIEKLKSFGLSPFVVGGTLLGGVRDGKLLPHDDDADIAYLSSHTNPADVALEGYEVGRRLKALGYKVMRHSATHMQLHFTDNKVSTYIDVFAAFFTSDGFINQPFHVRGKMDVEDMLPFGSVNISGHNFPTPNNTEKWLTINYDANWRTPIPGFKIETPLETRRRFENWFGSFNFNRHFWNDFYETENPGTSHEGVELWQPGKDWISSETKSLSAPVLLDLGSGSGELPSVLARETERRVVATDFAENALLLLRYRGLETHHLNLYRLNSIALLQSLGIHTAFDLTLNHVLDTVGEHARENIFRLAKQALISGGSALATLFAKPAPGVHPEDPTLWHLSRSELAREAKKHGLGMIFYSLESSDQVSIREPYSVRFNLSPEKTLIPKEKVTMKQIIANFLMNFRPGSAQRQIAELSAEVESLKAELDEHRELASRVAQLTDMLEERLNQ